jgi:hypothetical protein
MILAAGTALAADDLAGDMPKSWKVGFAAWGGAGLEAQDEYLKFSLPLALRDRLLAARERELGSDEREAFARRLALAKVEALEAQLRDANRARDELLFKQLPESEREAALAPLDKKRDDLLASIALFQDDTPYLAVLPQEMPLSYDPATLIDAPSYSAAAAARKAGVDFLVWGRLEPVQGYLYWRVACYGVLLDRELFAAEQVSAPEEVAAAVEAAVGGLAEALLARPWSALVVAPKPADAAVRVDGKAQGGGTVTLPFLEPGPHHVEVSYEGYRTYDETLLLEPSAARRLEVTLTEMPASPVTLASDPPGALVYRDSMYVGVTPLDLLLPPGSIVTYRLVSDGYFDLYETVRTDGVSRVEAALTRKLVDPNEWQEIKRKRFYRSLGALALSVPISVVSYAVALDAAVARENTIAGTPEYDTLTRRATIGYAAYLGGIFVSVVLGVRMIRDLRDYVRYADDPQF